MYFDRLPPNSDSVKVHLSFLGVKHIKGGDHLSIAKAIKESFEEIELDKSYDQKLIWLNRGCKESIMTVLKEKSPWMLFLWCVAHRLELGLEDALSSTSFKDVDEMLRQMFYLYWKAPKKFRQLKELHDEYKQVFEFDDGGVKPKKANGSRRISHKLAALKMCKDKLGLYIAHLKNIQNDESYKSSEKAKMDGYLTKWKTSKMILQVCFFIDWLTIPSILSLIFQKDDINPVESVKAMEKTLDRLETFMKKDFEKLTNVRDFLSNVKETEGEYSYQGVKLSNFENVKKNVSKEKNYFAGLVRDNLSERLNHEEESEKTIKNLVTILDCEKWERQDEDFANDIMFDLYDTFEKPLKNAGVKCSAVDMLYQWHELVDYAKDTVRVCDKSYMVTWRKMFASPRSKNWEGILTPISNAKLERIFSKLKGSSLCCAPHYKKLVWIISYE